jgi:hypothetical protein
MAEIRDPRVAAQGNPWSKRDVETDAARDPEHGDVAEVLPILNVRADDKMQCRPTRWRGLAARDRDRKNDDYEANDANDANSDKTWMHTQFSAKGDCRAARRGLL